MSRVNGVILILVVALSGVSQADQAAPSPVVTEQATTHQNQGIRVGIQANAAKVVGESADDLALGFGFAARGGYEFRLHSFSLIPEISANWNRWGADGKAQMQGLASAWSLGILPGARAGVVFGAAMPWVAFHLGYSHVGASMAMGTCGAPACSADQFAIDTGVGLDYRLGRISMGPAVLYNVDFLSPDRLQWLSFGISGTLN